MFGKPVAGISSIGNDDNHRWKDSVQSAAEIRLWLLECIANGMRPWAVKFCGTLYDKRWVPPVEEVYQWHFENQKFWRTSETWRGLGWFGRRRRRPRLESQERKARNLASITRWSKRGSI